MQKNFEWKIFWLSYSILESYEILVRKKDWRRNYKELKASRTSWQSYIDKRPSKKISGNELNGFWEIKTSKWLKWVRWFKFIKIWLEKIKHGIRNWRITLKNILSSKLN
jgi:hypothetical protein